MRIVIDMQGAQTESRYRGIGRYSMSLARAIARQAGAHEVWLALNANYPDTIETLRKLYDDIIPKERIITFNTPTPISWDNPDNRWRIRAAEYIREHFFSLLQADIILITSVFEGGEEDACSSVRSLTPGHKTAVILYDLIPFLDPETYLPIEWAREWYMDKIAYIKRADLLLAISEHSRQDAINNLNVDPGHIVSISTAIAETFRPSQLNLSDTQILYDRYGIRRPYIMYSGAIEGRKNLARLLEAFALLPANIRQNRELVFVGKYSEPERQHLYHIAQKLEISEQLTLTGYVPDNVLIALYSQCDLFVFPSLHEGFGLPALEAMACGAPTIGSNTTSIPEVIGRDDALFDPTSAQAIAEKITSVLSNEKFRADLREHGLVQSELFSWDECAKRAINAFEQIFTHEPIHRHKTWREIFDHQKSAYSKLISSISSISTKSIRPSDSDLVNCATSIAENTRTADQIVRAHKLPEKISWRIEGPFDSSYSLALLNRETARALDALGHNVSLHSTEGPGDFSPDEKFLRDNTDLARLYKHSEGASPLDVDVTSRNLYPPRVSDMVCRVNLLHHYAWEETGFPMEWAEDFNDHLQGITCLSSHVKKIMIDHGVTVPLSVSGCGVDHWERVKPDISLQTQGRSFKFLHVSSCFPRKGADLLLKAYGSAFTNCDDVTLIIKTFDNPHNEIHHWLSQARKKQSDFPDVIIIEEDFSEPMMKALYQECDVLVAPSLAEGFGLPLAEAMLSGLAVITTGWGGQLDFCNEETAWLVNYTFAPARTHLNLFDSVWAVPDTDHLADIMRKVYESPPSLRKSRSKLGRHLLLDNFRWSDVANRIINSARSWAQLPKQKKPSIGWITTWNTLCGIATYSEHLISNMPSDISIFAAHTVALTKNDESNVVRCWNTGEHDTLEILESQLELENIDTIVLQFNYGFYNHEHLSNFLKRQIDKGTTVVIMMHSTLDPVHAPYKKLNKIQDSLIRCHRILVHTPEDMNRLKEIGLVDNVTLFPHGILDYPANQNNCLRHQLTIASYGFFLPHKGLLELIDTLKLLRSEGIDIRLRMVNAKYPIPESEILIEEVRKKALSCGVFGYVEMTTEFLPDDESLSLLSEADLIIFPYQETGESASGAVRYGLATGRPIAVTPLPIFDDVAPAVNYLPGQSPEDMAKGIKKIINQTINEPDVVKKQTEEADRWREAHRYSRLGLRLNGLLHALSTSNMQYDSSNKTLEKTGSLTNNGLHKSTSPHIA